MIENYLKRIVEKCQVFARMKPNEKTSLITYLQQKENQIVGMCGGKL